MRDKHKIPLNECIGYIFLRKEIKIEQVVEMKRNVLKGSWVAS